MEYNTSRPKMIIPEYGRSIQKMVDHAVTLEDREERNKMAKAIIAVMGQLHPHLRDVNDFKHKLWHHLFIMSDFKLDVDSPYPLPSRETMEKKPDQVSYPSRNIRFKHYGKIVEDLIAKAIEMEDGEMKDALVDQIGNLMKRSYLTWNRDSVTDEVIVEQLDILSKGNLRIKDLSKLSSAQDIVAKNRNQQNQQMQKKKQMQKNNNFSRMKRNNQHNPKS